MSSDQIILSIDEETKRFIAAASKRIKEGLGKGDFGELRMLEGIAAPSEADEVAYLKQVFPDLSESEILEKMTENLARFKKSGFTAEEFTRRNIDPNIKLVNMDDRKIGFYYEIDGRMAPVQLQGLGGFQDFIIDESDLVSLAKEMGTDKLDDVPMPYTSTRKMIGDQPPHRQKSIEEIWGPEVTSGKLKSYIALQQKWGAGSKSLIGQQEFETTRGEGEELLRSDQRYSERGAPTFMQGRSELPHDHHVRKWFGQLSMARPFPNQFPNWYMPHVKVFSTIRKAVEGDPILRHHVGTLIAKKEGKFEEQDLIKDAQQIKTIETKIVQDPRLNNGNPTLIPTDWSKARTFLPGIHGEDRILTTKELINLAVVHDKAKTGVSIWPTRKTRKELMEYDLRLKNFWAKLLDDPAYDPREDFAWLFKFQLTDRK